MNYADTSFLASLYTPDANSAAAAAKMRSIKPPLILTSLGEIELTNAFELRLFRHELTASEVMSAHSALREDIQSGFFFLVPLPAAAFSRARKISLNHTAQSGSRTLDILHVAAALVLEASGLYTFDRNQTSLAAAEGLNIL